MLQLYIEMQAGCFGTKKQQLNMWNQNVTKCHENVTKLLCFEKRHVWKCVEPKCH